jgi:hypothetical protein
MSPSTQSSQTFELATAEQPESTQKLWGRRQRSGRIVAVR